MHEIMGPGARAFCAAQAVQGQKLVWITAARSQERLMPATLARFLDLSGLLIVRPTTEVDLLWSAEEALRSGAARVVIAEPSRPLSLTAGRRLQLAAAAGRATGLLLISEGHGSPATETRWRISPHFAAGSDSTLLSCDLIKNKSGTFGSWMVSWDGAAHRFTVVSPAGERGRVAAPAG